ADIAMMAESVKMMQDMLNVCHTHSVDWGYKFNVDKCAVMFSEAGGAADLVLGGQAVPRVTVYKYLGVEIEADGRFTLVGKRLTEKAEKAANMIWGKGILRNIDANAGTTLWNGVVKPILEYGAEVWWEKGEKKADEIQKKFARRL